MIKCVLLDIGNTLVSKSGNNVVAPVLKMDILRLRKQGIKVGVASMRTYDLAKRILNGIDFDFYIFLSGAQIYVDDKLCYDQPIEYQESAHPYVIYYSNSETYALDEVSANLGREKGFVVETVKSSHTENLYNVSLLDVEGTEVDSYKSTFHTEYWSRIKVLVLQNPLTSKANAVDFIANYYGVKHDELLGFGDGPNDIEFLSRCGISVAMGKNYKELMDSTTFATDKEGNLGVSKALRKLGLIQDKVILFIESVNEIGGMEMHGMYFMDYFKEYTELIVVTHQNNNNVIVYKNNTWINARIDDIGVFIKEYDAPNTMVFFNSGHWIEEMSLIRYACPKSTIFYRTGGNDIISSPMLDLTMKASDRRVFWKNTINEVVNHLITNSDLTERRLVDFGIKNHILYKVVGGVNVAKIQQLNDQYFDIRKELFKHEGRINLVSVTRFEPYKRVELLLQTMSLLDSHLYHLYLIGNGPLFNELYNKYNHLEQATFLGKQAHDTALKYICAADFYIQFSGDTVTNLDGLTYIHTEGMGRTLLEAITARTRVIVTRCGAFEEIIDDTRGVIMDSSDPKELSIIIKEQQKIEKEKQALEIYDFDHVFNRYLNLWWRDEKNTHYSSETI